MIHNHQYQIKIKQLAVQTQECQNSNAQPELPHPHSSTTASPCANPPPSLWTVQAQRAETRLKNELSDCQRKLAQAEVDTIAPSGGLY
jgi:hypothetical protein